MKSFVRDTKNISTRSFAVSLILHGALLAALSLLVYGNPSRPPLIVDFTLQPVGAERAMKGPPKKTTVFHPTPHAPTVVPSRAPAPVKKKGSLPHPKPAEPKAAPLRTMSAVTKDTTVREPVGAASPPEGDLLEELAAQTRDDAIFASSLLAAARPRRDARHGSAPKGNPTLAYNRLHFRSIRDAVEAVVDYPYMARRMGWQGQVVVSFTVTMDGRVHDVKIRKSSGFEILDKNAILAVHKAQPLPRPPVVVTLVIPVRYILGG